MSRRCGVATQKKSCFRDKIDGLHPLFSLRAELFLLIFLILVFALVLFACRRDGGNGHASSVSRFADGTYVLGEDIGGLTVSEAEARLRQEIENAQSGYRCRLYCGEREFFLDAEKVNVESDLAIVLNNAMLSGAGEYAVLFHPADDEKLNTALENIAAELREEAVPAKLIPRDEATEEELASGESNARFTVTAAKAGTEPNLAAARRLVLAGGTVIDFPVSHPQPAGTRPKLPQRMAVFATSFAGNGLSAPNRVANITKAASLINGAALAPGERFSCNAALGERTEEAGWKSATAFANGGRDTEQQFGGGICQVSTTLYNCALRAGLSIDQRAGHSRRVRYVPGGLDAALSWGGADLVIRNNLSDTVYFFMWTDENESKLYCEICGPGFGGGYDGISVESELIEKLEPGEAEFVTDPALSPGECVLKSEASSGSVYRSWRIFTKNGAELYRELIAETVYPARSAVYAVPPGTDGQ